jgi:hypothetical protein
MTSKLPELAAIVDEWAVVNRPVVTALLAGGQAAR